MVVWVAFLTFPAEAILSCNFMEGPSWPAVCFVLWYFLWWNPFEEVYNLQLFHRDGVKSLIKLGNFILWRHVSCLPVQIWMSCFVGAVMFIGCVLFEGKCAECNISYECTWLQFHEWGLEICKFNPDSSWEIFWYMSFGK